MGVLFLKRGRKNVPGITGFVLTAELEERLENTGSLKKKSVLHC